MRERFPAHGWAPDLATVGLLVFGFSLLSATSELLLANVALGEVFNSPPAGFASFPNVPFAYPLSVRVAAGSAFIVGCAAVFAAAGGLAMFARMPWGATLAAAALGVDAAATIVNVIAQPRGMLVIEELLSVVWTVALIFLVTGFRSSLPRPRNVGADTTGSWMEETVLPDRDEGQAG